VDNPILQPLDRVKQLLAQYSHPSASAAYLLCDRHDPAHLAYRIIAPDLSYTDLTYGDLRTESERLVAGLARLGLQPGDRIATLMGKSRAYLVTLMAIWRLGAVHVPLFTAFAAPAINFRLTASNCSLVFCDPAQRPKLIRDQDAPNPCAWRVVTTGPADPGAISYKSLLDGSPPALRAAALGGNAPIIQPYTSGTTGSPKGVLVPLRAVASFEVYAEYGLGLRSDDIFWNAADPGWAYGLYFGIVASFATGVRSLLLESNFSAEATLEVLKRFRVTNFTAAPTVYRSLRLAGAPKRSHFKLRHASSAGEPLTPQVNEWASNSLGVKIHDHYGQTEAGMLINNHHHPELQRPLKNDSMGHEMPGWKACILKADGDEPAIEGEVGRVAIELAASPLAWFEGYVDDPVKSAEKFSPNGRWYYTGDTGYRDAEGYFHFSARDDDVIIMAGYRIGPSDVESVLVTHPGVSECAVVAAPDAVRGEVLEAVVVLRAGTQPSSELTAELQNWVRHRYAAHAYPRRVHYAGSLPRTPSGKLQRFVLRRQLREEMANKE
jgi:acetyl-CoA synthetase